MSHSRPDLDTYFMAMLKLVASRSTCVRRQVGAIITDDAGRVLSTGYNGVPSGFPHCIDAPCLGANDEKGDSSRCLSVHAEANALLQCTRLDLARWMYCSCSPCFTCAKLICNTPINRVIYGEEYADQMGLRVLHTKGVEPRFFDSVPRR